MCSRSAICRWVRPAASRRRRMPAPRRRKSRRRVSGSGGKVAILARIALTLNHPESMWLTGIWLPSRILVVLTWLEVSMGEGVRMSVWLAPGQLERIDRLREQADASQAIVSRISRNAIIRTLIAEALDARDHRTA